MNFDLNINNYKLSELEDIFELPRDYNEDIFHSKETKLRKNIMSNNTIKSDLKPKILELNKTLFENILKDPVLHMFLNSIYPKGYHCTTYSSNTLRKNEDYTGWHCDYPYHDIEAPYPQETLGVQVIWTLDDFTNENGATHYVPESYKKRCFPYNIDKENVERMIAPFGTVIIYLAKTWHTQGINTTDKPRSALLANFSPLFVPIKS